MSECLDSVLYTLYSGTIPGTGPSLNSTGGVIGSRFAPGKVITNHDPRGGLAPPPDRDAERRQRNNDCSASVCVRIGVHVVVGLTLRVIGHHCHHHHHLPGCPHYGSCARHK